MDKNLTDVSPWALVQFRGPDGTVRVGVSDVGSTEAPEVEEVADFDGLTMLDILARWDEFEPVLRNRRPTGIARSKVELLAPVTYPGKIICCGANYFDHIAEMGLELPAGTIEPFFFMKPPRTTVVGTGELVTIKPGVDLDWEAELGVVIGRRCSQIQAGDADRYIAGYVVANDLSSRGSLVSANPIAPPFKFDWLRAKALDSSCPLGPNLVPAWLVPHPQDIRIRLSVNGTMWQDASTSGMITPIAEIIAAASSRMTLEPGDVILTGTPAGVGAPTHTYLRHGDTVRITIDGIGDLYNHFVGANSPLGQTPPIESR